jgi:hypothetical protein
MKSLLANKNSHSGHAHGTAQFDAKASSDKQQRRVGSPPHLGRSLQSPRRAASGHGRRFGGVHRASGCPSIAAELVRCDTPPAWCQEPTFRRCCRHRCLLHLARCKGTESAAIPGEWYGQCQTSATPPPWAHAPTTMLFFTVSTHSVTWRRCARAPGPQTRVSYATQPP